MNFQILIIMKVYCPSHNRPDAPLFSMTVGLNIVVQYEDVESYSKWNDRHNVIYVPELRGLLDVRNWILEQSDDWVLMTDDDVLEIKEIKDKNRYDITWDRLISETENVLNQLDKNEIGVVGYNVYGKTNFTEQYEVSTKFNLYGAVVLNAPLLKSRGFRYEGYPFDGVGGQKAHGEDTDLLFYCYANNIQTIRINNLFLIFNHHWEMPTIAWGNHKNKKRKLILSSLWLMGKYRDYPRIVKQKEREIKNFLRIKVDDYSTEELYNDIVNEVSEETLNKFEGEKEMKKMLIGGLVLLMMSGLFVSCPEKPEDDDKGNSHNGLKVAEEYRGDWYLSTTNASIQFQLTSSEYIRWVSGSKGSTRPAWTVDNEGIVELWVYENLKDTKWGTFTDSSTFDNEGTTYVKR